jgi:hypothetical protein
MNAVMRMLHWILSAACMVIAATGITQRCKVNPGSAKAIPLQSALPPEILRMIAGEWWKTERRDHMQDLVAEILNKEIYYGAYGPWTDTDWYKVTSYYDGKFTVSATDALDGLPECMCISAKRLLEMVRIHCLHEGWDSLTEVVPEGWESLAELVAMFSDDEHENLEWMELLHVHRKQTLQCFLHSALCTSKTVDKLSTDSTITGRPQERA